jgi:hypothetical protein
MVMSEDAWPFLQVWLEIVSRGGRGDLVYRDAERAIAQGFIDWIAARKDNWRCASCRSSTVSSSSGP